MSWRGYCSVLQALELTGSTGDYGRRLTAVVIGFGATARGRGDVIVNCTLQDTAAPLMFLSLADLDVFRHGSLIVDVSCDEGMGFEWATPTTFDDPMFTVADKVDHYAVDHSPSYLWNSATWENGEALLPFLPIVLAGPDAWDLDETISRAIEIRDGHVVNPAILTFQSRAAEHPHLVR